MKILKLKGHNNDIFINPDYILYFRESPSNVHYLDTVIFLRDNKSVKCTETPEQVFNKIRNL
jgi:hypothetical protein